MESDRKIIITIGSLSAECKLNDSETAGMIFDALPIEARGNTWGDEIYFSIPVETEQEHPQETVEMGDLAYWPPGRLE